MKFSAYINKVAKTHTQI